MKHLIEQYGTFIRDSMVVITLLLIVFCNLSDGEGHKGIFSIIGAKMDIEDADYLAYKDFREVYKSESQKTAPQIFLQGGRFTIGMHALSDYIKAVDDVGNLLPIHIKSIKAPDGTELMTSYHPDTTQIYMSGPGVYTITVSASDHRNKTTKTTIQIPVNSN